MSNEYFVKHCIHTGKTFSNHTSNLFKLIDSYKKQLSILKINLPYFLNSNLSQLKNIHFILDSVKWQHQSAV